MEPEEHIKRMAEEGLLDETQAEMFRASFTGLHGVEPVPNSGVARVRGLFLGSAAILVVLVIFMLAGGGPEMEVIQDVSKTINEPGGHGAMNRTISTLLAIGLMIIVPVILGCCMHNSLVAHAEMVF